MKYGVRLNKSDVRISELQLSILMLRAPDELIRRQTSSLV